MNKVQYSHYVEDGRGILRNKDEVFEDCLDAVKQEVQRNGHPLSAIGPASFSFLEPFLTPYINHTTKPRVIAEISQSDIPTLICSGIRIGNRDETGHISLKDVVIRTVFGVSERTPLRSLSYLLPALHMVEALRQSRKFSELPQIQYIVMAQSGVDLNGFEKDTIYRQAELLAFFGRHYIQQFYPALTSNSVFAHDEFFIDHPEVSYAREEIQSNQQAFDELNASGILDTHNNKGKQNVFEYFVRHPLVHDFVYKSSPFASFDEALEINCVPKLLINIGGQREKLFYTARKILLHRYANGDASLAQRVQLFSHHKTPPYIPLELGMDTLEDIAFGQIVQHPQQIFTYMAQLEKRYEHNLLFKDYDVLARDTEKQFEYFVEETARKVS